MQRLPPSLGPSLPPSKLLVGANLGEHFNTFLFMSTSPQYTEIPNEW